MSSFTQSPRGLVSVCSVLLLVGLVSAIGCPEPPFSREALEAILITNLEAIRSALDAHAQCMGQGPGSLQILVEQGYFPGVPVDPMARMKADWELVRDKRGFIVDVRSTSKKTALDGTRYEDW